MDLWIDDDEGIGITSDLKTIGKMLAEFKKKVHCPLRSHMLPIQELFSEMAATFKQELRSTEDNLKACILQFNGRLEKLELDMQRHFETVNSIGQRQQAEADAQLTDHRELLNEIFDLKKQIQHISECTSRGRDTSTDRREDTINTDELSAELPVNKTTSFDASVPTNTEKCQSTRDEPATEPEKNLDSMQACCMSEHKLNGTLHGNPLPTALQEAEVAIENRRNRLVSDSRYNYEQSGQDLWNDLFQAQLLATREALKSKETMETGLLSEQNCHHDTIRLNNRCSCHPNAERPPPSNFQHGEETTKMQEGHPCLLHGNRGNDLNEFHDADAQGFPHPLDAVHNQAKSAGKKDITKKPSRLKSPVQSTPVDEDIIKVKGKRPENEDDTRELPGDNYTTCNGHAPVIHSEEGSESSYGYQFRFDIETEDISLGGSHLASMVDNDGNRAEKSDRAEKAGRKCGSASKSPGRKTTACDSASPLGDPVKGKIVETVADTVKEKATCGVTRLPKKPTRQRLDGEVNAADYSRGERERVRNSDTEKRRAMQHFRERDVETLIAGVEQLGKGRWKELKRNWFLHDRHRTPVDLKDKWRSLVRTAKCPSAKKKGHPYPADWMARVLKADRL